MSKKLFERSKGFTLVELMVVIAIIGILAVAALGVVRGAQQRALKAAVQATSANLTTALESYYTVSGNSYPTSLDHLATPPTPPGATAKVLDKTPTVKGCQMYVTGGTATSLNSDVCGIAYSGSAQSYTIWEKFPDGTTDTLTGGV